MENAMLKTKNLAYHPGLPRRQDALDCVSGKRQRRREFWYKVRISVLILASNAIGFFLAAAIGIR
jgi:hypothetical protein